MVLTTGALIGSALVSGLSAGAGAIKRGQAADTQNAWFDWAEQNNRSRYYYDPTTGERALLKNAKQDIADTREAVNNMLAAGGATAENRLAAMKAGNERFDKLQNQLIAANQSRRDRLDDQMVQLKQQRANMQANNYLQAAQDWNKWGQQTASAILSYGSTGLLDGAGTAAASGLTNAQGAEAMGVAAKGLVNADMMQPIGDPSLTELPGAGLGGLRGPGYDISKSALTADARFPWTPD